MPLLVYFERDNGACSPAPLLSYHRDMLRTDLYLKVELDLDEGEKPERLASEICRTIRKIYGVRGAEISSIVERDPER